MIENLQNEPGQLKKSRIWEIDVLRAFAILWMVVNHAMYNLGWAFYYYFSDTVLYSLAVWARYTHVSNFYGTLTFIFCSGLFICIAGICSTFSRSNLKRGALVCVLACVITVVSVIAGEFLGTNVTIVFGILHCLGICIVLSHFFNKLNKWLILALAALFIFLGEWFSTITVSIKFLVIFNFECSSFFSADYYPLLPYFGVFLIGMFLGKTLYKNKVSLFKIETPVFLAPLVFIGRHPLKIYIGHQVVLYALFFILIMIV